MNSRFVNLAVKHMSGYQAPFSLHRINPANLFYPAGSPVPIQGSAETMEDLPLPSPFISFECPETPGQHCSMDFMAFGRNRDKIIVMESTGSNFIYDAFLSCIRDNMPMMPQPMVKPMHVSFGDEGLFVMSGGSSPQFVALRNGPSPISTYAVKPNRSWESLQPPPFPGRSCDEDVQDPFEISAYAAVGDAQIWVSTMGADTFSVDTKSGAWSRAGEWAMPFRGRAEYVPEHNLWFGFSNGDEKQQQLCASDLTGAMSAARSPVPKNLWIDMVWPKDWKLTSTHLLSLSSGRLCIARFVQTSDCDDEDMSGLLCRADNFVVLAGVEVVSDYQGRLRMIRHKSQRYNFGDDVVNAM